MHWIKIRRGNITNLEVLGLSSDNKIAIGYIFTTINKDGSHEYSIGDGKGNYYLDHTTHFILSRDLVKLKKNIE